MLHYIYVPCSVCVLTLNTDSETFTYLSLPDVADAVAGQLAERLSDGAVLCAVRSLSDVARTGRCRLARLVT